MIKLFDILLLFLIFLSSGLPDSLEENGAEYDYIYITPILFVLFVSKFDLFNQYEPLCVNQRKRTLIAPINICKKSFIMTV